MSGYLYFYAKHPALTRIAEAMNQAGHAFHNTVDWQENPEYFDGKTPCEFVQAAFDAADTELEAGKSAPCDKLIAGETLMAFGGTMHCICHGEPSRGGSCRYSSGPLYTGRRLSTMANSKDLRNENARLRRALSAAVRAMDLMHDPSGIEEGDITAAKVQKTIERCRTLLERKSAHAQKSSQEGQ